MNKAWWWVGIVVVPAVIAPIAFGGCEVTIQCEDGACASSAVGTTGTGNGECLPLPTDPDTHGFPRDVFAVLNKNCYTCHGDPLQSNAPHSFNTYDQTQEPYYSTDLKWWSQMREHAVKNTNPSMPFQLDPIPDCQKAILTAWFDTCGADTDAGKCARGMGATGSTSSTGSSTSASTGSGTGGAGGAMTSSSSTGP